MSEPPIPTSLPTPAAPAPLAPVHDHIEDLLIEDELRNCYLAYAMSVNVSRALPDVRDGLKPVQRRILYGMHRSNVRGKTIKCAKVVGEVMGNYHPHGDSSIYDALVRMAQPWSMRHPLIASQGNFGSDDGDEPAAMRYTECKLAAIAEEMLADIDEETVDFGPNFDDSTTEPTVLPGRLPNLLINGASGIGVAMATNIPPHNLNEICDGIAHLLTHPDATVDQLLEHVKGPDFPTRAMICGRKGIVDAYTTGRGSVTVRARSHLEDRRGVRRLVFTEFPFQVIRKSITEKIGELIRDGKLDGASHVNDASDKDGLKLHVEIKRDADPDVVLNQLYEYTQLQHSFPVMMVGLLNGRPQLCDLRQLLQAYIDHRREVLRRRTIYRLRKARARAHVLEGLILAIADIDGVIALIRQSPNPATAKERLMARPLRLSEQVAFAAALPEAFRQEATAAPRLLSLPQAEAILAMTLSRLTGLAIEELAGEYRGLVTQIGELQTLLDTPAMLDQQIADDLAEIKRKFGEPRRTELTAPVGDYNREDLIKEEEMVVTISHEGYIKRMALAQYRSRGRGTRGLTGAGIKDGDFVEKLYVAVTHDTMLFFTSIGKMHCLKVYEIPELDRTSKGRPLPNLLELAEGEKVTAVVPVREFDERFVVTATAAGLVKKTALHAYSRPKKGGIIAVGLDEGDQLIGVAITDGRCEIVLGTAQGLSIRFSEDEVRAMGRNAVGVYGIRPTEGDRVVGMVVVQPAAPEQTLPDLLTVCRNGYGKRTALEEYRGQGRGGKGVINIKTSERNGEVVALLSVRDSDDLMMISSRGVMNRISVADVRAIGRATQGVRLMNLDDGDSVVGVAGVVKPDEEPTGSAPPEGMAPSV